MAAASIVDGKLADRVDTTSTAKTTVGSGNSSMDKEAFLQLLVAQMKYQDPLEPTSNTEYIAQYATFSQVEMLQNMSRTMDTSAAMQLVGKTVTVETENGNGSTSQVTGVVDYVEKSNGKNLLYIDGVPYNYDNLVNVWNEDYLEAQSASGNNGTEEMEEVLQSSAASDKTSDTAQQAEKTAQESEKTVQQAEKTVQESEKTAKESDVTVPVTDKAGEQADSGTDVSREAAEAGLLDDTDTSAEESGAIQPGEEELADIVI